MRNTKSDYSRCDNRFGNWIKAFPDEKFDHRYIFDTIGYNLQPTELQAAIAIEQLKKLPEIIEKRNRNFNLLLKIFNKYKEFFHLPYSVNSSPAWFVFPLTLRENCPFKRDTFCNYLENNKIQVRAYFTGNILLQPAYEGLMNPTDAIRKFPVATYVMKNTFFIGVAPHISKEMISYIEEIVDKFFKMEV